MLRFTPFILFIFLIFAASASAEEEPPPDKWGLAMHGTPKYGPHDTHLDYANPYALQGGTLTMAGIGTFDTVNPFSIKGKAADGLNLVYDRLMARVWDEPFTMYPLIAERVDIPEDRSAITVHINPKARFHDGRAVTADDVIFSFETLRDEGRPNMRRIYRLVDKVEKIDDLSVHFAFGEGYDKETVMIIAMMPVLSKSWWKGRTFDQTTLDFPSLNGPYKISSVDPGRRIVYERVKDYWANDLLTNVGHFNYDRIIYDYYRDDTVAFEAFKSGDIDLRREWDAGKWASAYDFPAVQNGKVVAEALPHGRPEKVRAMIFNTRRAPFDDIRVRKALNLLFDFDWINKNLFHGQYHQIDSTFPNSELAAPPALKEAVDTRTKMRMANQLLNEAGWTVENGKRMKNGETLSFEIILSAPEDEKIALHFKRALEKMGIAMNLRVLDSASFLRRMNEFDYDMTLHYWGNSLSPGTEQYLYWGCDLETKETGRLNYSGVCDPEVTALAQSIPQAENRESLVSQTKKLDRKLMDLTLFIPLYYAGEDYVAYWKPIVRPEKTPLYGMVLETWWMDAGEDANQD